MFTAKPDLEISKSLIREYNGKVKSSLIHIRDSLDINNSEIDSKLNNTINSLDGGLVKAEVYAIYSKICAYIIDKKIELAIDEINKLPSSSRNNEIEVAAFVNESIINPVIVDSYESTYAMRYPGKEPQESIVKRSLSEMKKAISILEEVYPNYFQSIKQFISKICIYDSTIAAGTCFNALGYMYVSCLKEDQDWTRYFGDIIHESSHTHLYCLTLLDPIVIDPDDQLFMTPLRTEPRPLYMAFHQMYVLARTLSGLGKLWENKTYSYLASDGMDVSYTGEYVESDFKKAANLIKDNISLLSDSGKALFNSAVLISGVTLEA